MQRRERSPQEHAGSGTRERAIDFPDMGILAEQLRAAIKKDPRSLLELEKASGVSRAILYRLLNGERDVRLETADRLLEVLGLEMKLSAKRRATKKQ